MQKYEEEARGKVSVSVQAYQNQLRATQEMRNNYYHRNLPRFVRVIKGLKIKF
jgi:hypothetical protein